MDETPKTDEGVQVDLSSFANEPVSPVSETVAPEGGQSEAIPAETTEKKTEVDPEPLTSEEKDEAALEALPQADPAYNCPDCKGHGLKDERTLCPTCQGTGKV